MDQGLRGKRVLVTGAARGIGRAITLAFAEAGASVAGCYHQSASAAERLSEELAALAKETGAQHHLVRCDVTQPADARRFVESASTSLGGVDVLVNNVGADGAAKFEDLAEDEWHRVVDRNLTSAYLVTKAALGAMSDGASIVNIGGAAAMRGRPMAVHYCASKAALVGFTRSLCKELGPRGIRVNTVAPGPTPGEAGPDLPPPVLGRIVAMTALGRLGTPEDVAGAVLFLAGDTSRYITGITLNVDGGI